MCQTVGMLITLEAVVAQVVRQQEEHAHNPTVGFEHACQHGAGCIHAFHRYYIERFHKFTYPPPCYTYFSFTRFAACQNVFVLSEKDKAINY